MLLGCEKNLSTSTLNHNVAQFSNIKLFIPERYYPYKVKLTHELNESDPDQHLQFCKQVIFGYDQNPKFFNNIFISDEAVFCLNGVVNNHNCRY